MTFFPSGFFFVLGSFFLFVGTSCNQQAQIQSAASPNIIIFLADDLGYGDLGCFGHPTIKTPNLDRLAAGGLKLTRCYAASPVCSPSRAGLLTGLNPNRLGIYDWIPEQSPMHIADSIVTIAEVVKQAGYQTAMFGKYHCNGHFNQSSQPQPDDQGFDYWMATQNNASPSHYNPINFVLNGQAMGEQKGYSANIVAKKLMAWLDKRNTDHPFFAYVPFHEPHEPIDSPQELVAQYSETITEDQAQYFANVSNMDRAIGEILEKLKQDGILDNTLIIFTSDNGPETLNRYPGTHRSYGSPGALKGMKVHLWEGGIRVPGIIHWPAKVKPAQASTALVSSLDFLPTIAELIKVQPPRGDGESILPLLQGDTTFQREKELFWFYPTAVRGPNVAMIKGQFKIEAFTYFRYIAPDDLKGIFIGNRTIRAIKQDSLASFQWYDLSAYPSEAQDLSSIDSPIFQTLKNRMEDLFYRLRADSPVVVFTND